MLVSDTLKNVIYSVVAKELRRIESQSVTQLTRSYCILQLQLLTIKCVFIEDYKQVISLDIYPINAQGHNKKVSLFYSKDIEKHKFMVFDKEKYKE